MKNRLKLFIRLSVGLMLLLVFAVSPIPSNAQKTLPPKGIPEGYSVIDGDILMPTEYVEAVLKGQKLSPDAPHAAYTPSVWESGTFPFVTRGIVPFEFDSNVSAANQSAMISAMAILENAANVHFQQCANNLCGVTNYVHITNSSINSSSVGMIGGIQFVTIKDWGLQFKIVHELVHCLGFFHEQSRPDRDNFIQINCGNLQGGCNNNTIYNSNFQLTSALTFGTYDFDSIMQYDQCGFSIDCMPGQTCACTNPVITVLPPNQSQQTLIGQRTHLSSLDRATVGFLYPFGNWTLLDCTYTGNNGTPDGSFSRPYTTLAAALGDTPAGGTIWVLQNCTLPVGIYNNQVTIRAAPNVIATFEN